MGTLPTCLDLANQFVADVQNVNELGRTLVGEYTVFDEVSLTLIPLEPPELGFLKTVSYLFSHYFEVGRDHLDFLDGKLIHTASTGTANCKATARSCKNYEPIFSTR